jgi:hypothetical protein
VRVDADQRQILELPVRGSPAHQVQQLGHAQLPRRPLPDDLQPALDLSGIQLHPLAAETYQRLLQVGERGQFFLGERVVPDCKLPLEVDECVLTEAGAAAGDSARLCGASRSEAESEPRRAPTPPSGKVDAEPGRGKRRSDIAKEGVRVRGVQGKMVGSRGVQCQR